MSYDKSAIGSKKSERQAIPSVIADQLRVAIMNGKLAPGKALRQEELAAQFEASRIPVREALRQLEAEGLVAISPNKGATVVSLSVHELHELFEIRALLEPEAIKFAVPNITPKVLSQAAKLLDGIEQKTSETPWGILNWQFHLLLYQCANRPKLVSLIDGLRISSERYVRNLDCSREYKTHAQAEHRAILQACSEGNGKEAAMYVRTHILESSAQLMRQLA